ncbi:MAG: hypothetical protein KR126chlam1_01281 [Chlamydiae bacterium]|nr:hypothetical protein [Chlamydiota bacterium]
MATSLQQTSNITAFFQALGEENFDRVEELIEGMGDIDSPRDSCLPPLHWAAYQGKINVITFLLKKGIYIDSRDDEGRTALHVAIAAIQEVAFDTLITEGANVNVEITNSKNTPLHLAVLFESENIVRKLFKSGAQMTKNSDRETPRDFAVDLKNQSLISLLDKLAPLSS